MAYIGINKETIFMVYEAIPVGLYSWSIGLRERYLPLQHSHGSTFRQSKGKQVCSKKLHSWTSITLLQCVFLVSK